MIFKIDVDELVIEMIILSKNGLRVTLLSSAILSVSNSGT